MLDELRNHLTAAGAALVGCADLRSLPKEIREDLPRGVSIGAALDPAIVRGITAGPTLQYAAEYRRVNDLLGNLTRLAADFLTQCGYRAVARAVTVDTLDYDTLATPLPHKTVATLAGLGWVGKCALLITKNFGSAVRLGSVLTDAPLPPGEPVTAGRCGKCTDCVEACPASAPSGRQWQQGMSRADFFDAFACCRRAEELARNAGIAETICGVCIAACPHTQRCLKGDGVE